MPHFFTSNYDTHADSAHSVAISHPRDVPAKFSGTHDATLAPTEDMLNEYHDRQISHDEYAAQYKALLTERGITPEGLKAKYPEGTVFICFDYEDGDPSICHRIILGEWLTENGIETAEEQA